MFVEEFQRTGKTIFEAIDLTAQAFGEEAKEEVVVPPDPDAGVDLLNQSLMGARKR